MTDALLNFVERVSATSPSDEQDDPAATLDTIIDDARAVHLRHLELERFALARAPQAQRGPLWQIVHRGLTAYGDLPAKARAEATDRIVREIFDHDR